VRIDAETVRRALSRPSPFVPREWKAELPPAPAAVCIPIAFEPEPIAYAVLRNKDLRDHAGEVGFPGGKVEPGDVDLRATALRELAEEIALTDVEVLGALTPVPVITGRYMIHPFVTTIGASRPTIRDTEIAAVLAIPIVDYLAGRAPIEAVKSSWGGNEFLTPHFHLQDDVVLYGASAFIFWEFLLRVAAELAVVMPPPTLVDTYPWGDRYYSTRDR
jgi:8-oxo-dGTP pyrophosphatase MutT (NUDIX family)